MQKGIRSRCRHSEHVRANCLGCLGAWRSPLLEIRECSMGEEVLKLSFEPWLGFKQAKRGVGVPHGKRGLSKHRELGKHNQGPGALPTMLTHSWYHLVPSLP